MLSCCFMVFGMLANMEIVQPETPDLIRTSDLIAYVETINVDPVIKEDMLAPLPPGGYRTFPAQNAQVRILRTLKGEVSAESGEIVVLKKENGFFVSEDKRRVLYLKQGEGFYEALGNLGGEHRLASVIWELHRIKGEGYGVVIGLLGEPSGSMAVAFRGRHPVPLIPGSERWIQAVVKKTPIDELGVAEIRLEPGNYTILLRKGDNICHPSRLVNGFYPYLILDQESPWKIVYIQTRD
jgi:hypothetical protein